MGNRAWPSKACEPCREKRRKCDLKRPGCSQCWRASIKCPGYRDDLTLRLRNETQSTARKVQLKRGGKQPPTPSSDQEDAAGQRGASVSTTTTTTSSTNNPQDVPVSRPQEPQDIDRPYNSQASSSPGTQIGGLESGLADEHVELSGVDRARCDQLCLSSLHTDMAALAFGYFMQSYAADSPFHYLPEFYDTLLSTDKNLELAVAAPALVLLARDLRQPALLRLAYATYPVALAGTQKALASPDLVTLDSTLASVLLLSLYEALVFRGRRSPKSWHAHVQGSAALLQMRGERQFDSPLGWPLFSHASSNVRTSCLFRGEQVPLSLGVLYRQAALLPQSNSLSVRLGYLMDEFSVLRCQEAVMPASERVLRAYELDNELGAMMSCFSCISPYELTSTASITAQVHAYKDCVCYFISPKASKPWNTFRMLRLILSQYIWAVLQSTEVGTPALTESQKYPDEEWGWLRQLMAERAEEAITFILYGVPYLLELSDSPRASANTLIFPLSAIAVSKIAPFSAKLYARNRLKFISTQYDLEQAMESVTWAMEGGDLEDWALLPHTW